VGEYVVMLLVSAAVTYLLTPLVRRFAVRAGAIVPKRDRDVHAEPIPRMGGIAMYIGIAAGLLVASHSSLREIMPGTGLPGGLLAAGGLIVLIGIIDDRWGINAIAKLAGQVAAAGILVGSGVELQNFPLPSNDLLSLTPNESIVLTILVVVATINAINFIDGLDGLAAGIVCIAAISFFIYYYSLTRVVGGVSAEAVSALAAVVLAGACLGFLPHNFYPARIFMGDTGSMLLGLVLAYVPIAAISSLDYTSLQNKANRFPEILPLLLPAAVLVIPYSDMVRAVIRRTRAGLSPFAPDQRADPVLLGGAVRDRGRRPVHRHREAGRAGRDDDRRRAGARPAVDTQAALVVQAARGDRVRRDRSARCRAGPGRSRAGSGRSRA
jgi:UDP-GlcNAc:undecaprenyl-phosphate GlcNAc-1-phosphate transferase